MRKSWMLIVTLILASAVALAPIRASAALPAREGITTVFKAGTVNKTACVRRKVCRPGRRPISCHWVCM
jgi:hypothetical protein